MTFSAAKAGEILRHYPIDQHSIQVESLGSAGGMSGAQFWRIMSSRGTLCLRRWPVEHPSPQRLSFIHAVLQHAARRGISFIPPPITTHALRTFVHQACHLWQLEPWMPGTADYERTPRVEKLRAAMTALAQFHIATHDFEPPASSSTIPRRLAQLRELSQQGTTALSRAIDNAIWPDIAPLARQFIALLPSAIPLVITKLEPLAGVRLSRQPCLRDIWHDHILFTGDDVTGIIDFGAVNIDTPATDISRLLGSLVADDFEGWRTGLGAYSAERPLSPEESLAVVALDRSGIVLAGCNWIRWIYIERREFDNRHKVTDRFRKILARVAKIN
jgi:Ser/Thr protein kinase RdoA (MazF antagonist)